MTQYCRYCCFANLIGDDIFYCEVKNEVYNETKAKRTNKCKDFDFNPYDLFGCDENGNFREYSPRVKRQIPKQQSDFKQMEIEG